MKKKKGRPTLSKEGVLDHLIQTRATKSLKEKADRVGAEKVRKAIKRIPEKGEKE